ncbi:MFS transporter [Schumannella sp. 10F1B-5-1]|nr:MFS transporter [Schumannella sp. 10F1B-5-1]
MRGNSVERVTEQNTDHSAPDSAAAAAPTDAQRHGPRQVIAASVGNAVEWYDWYTYSFLAVFFSDQIFPGDDPVAKLLGSFIVFAASFLLRPIGGLVIGAIADRVGRRNTLTVTILLIGLGSLIVGLTPSFEQAGILAPIVLIIGRVISGLSIGGEFAANTTFLVESAPIGRRGLFSSFQYVSTTIGQLIASGLAAVLVATLGEGGMNDGGWRIPFIFGAVLSLVGLLIRRGAFETAAVASADEQGAASRRPRLFEALVRFPKQSLLIVGITIAGTIGYYTWTTYLPTYAEQNGGVDAGQALAVSTIGLFVFAALQPVAGILSDKVGRKPLLIGFAAILAIGIVPALAFLRSGPSFGGMLVVVLIGMVVLSGFTAISAAVNAELFPARVRAAGVGFPYSVAVALFGGTAPAIGTAFQQAGLDSAFGWYVAGLAVISLVVYVFLPETAHKKLDLGR